MTFRPDHSLDPKFNFDLVKDALTEATPLYVDGASIGTTINGNPAKNGQIVHYIADTTDGIEWTFRYRAASANASKWEFAGGSPLTDLVVTSPTSFTTTSTTYAALATPSSSPGPTINIPLTGRYLIEHGARMFGSLAGSAVLMSYDIAATGAVDGDAIDHTAAATTATSDYRINTHTFTAGDAIVAKYRVVGAQTGSFGVRWMKITPIRVT